MKKLTTFLLVNSQRSTVHSFFSKSAYCLLSIAYFFLFTANAQDSTSIRQLNEVVVSATRANEKTGMAFTNVYQKDIKKVIIWANCLQLCIILEEIIYIRLLGKDLKFPIYNSDSFNTHRTTKLIH